MFIVPMGYVVGFGVMGAAAATILAVLLRRSYLEAGRVPSRKRGFEVLPRRLEEGDERQGAEGAKERTPRDVRVGL